MKNNKIDKENKENISDNELLRASTSNEATQTLSIQEEKYSWTSDSDKCQVAVINYAWSYEEQDHTVFDCPHYICSSCSK